MTRAIAIIAAGLPLLMPHAVIAQPATALTATCETLPEALRTFKPRDDFVGIEIEG